MARKGVDGVIWHEQAAWLGMRDERAVGELVVDLATWTSLMGTVP